MDQHSGKIALLTAGRSHRNKSKVKKDHNLAMEKYKKKKRKCTSVFKTTVAMEALKERETLTA